jgi:hypothetical protein
MDVRASRDLRGKRWSTVIAPGTSAYQMYRDEPNDTLVCIVGKTTLGYRMGAIEDVRGAAARGARSRQAGAQRPQQPRAGALS